MLTPFPRHFSLVSVTPGKTVSMIHVDPREQTPFRITKMRHANIRSFLQNISILHSTSNTPTIVQLHDFMFFYLKIHTIRMHCAHEMLRARWGVDCTLGILGRHRLFLNNLVLRVEESQTLVESNKMPPLSMLGNNFNGRY